MKKLLYIWCEASSAYARGLPASAVIAIRGKATIGLWHPWYGGMGKSTTQAALNKWATGWKRAGAKALCIDAEGWIWKPSSIAMFAAAAKSVGLPLWAAPKATCDPGGRFLDGDFNRSVKCLQRHTSSCLLWSYGSDGRSYNALISRWRRSGYRGTLGVFQDQVRNGNGYRGKHVWRSVAKSAISGSYPFCLFLGNRSSSADVSELNKMFR